MPRRDDQWPGWAAMILLAAWPPATFALEKAAQLDVAGFPWLQFLMSGAVSLWGSMARTNQRNKSADAAQEPFPKIQEFWRDARRSSVIGAVVYMASVSQGLNDFQLAGALLIAGYSGPAALDLWAEKFKAKD